MNFSEQINNNYYNYINSKKIEFDKNFVNLQNDLYHNLNNSLLKASAKGNVFYKQRFYINCANEEDKNKVEEHVKKFVSSIDSHITVFFLFFFFLC